MKIRQVRLLIALLTVGAAACAVGAEIGPGDDIESAVAALSPGEELLLRDGTYVFDQNITLTANGTPQSPILIRAKDGAQVTLTQATGLHNVIEIGGSSYLILQGIHVTGGSHGIRLIDSDFITIKDCEIYETGDVALSANAGGTYEGLKILHNHIHHTNGTGEGMYLGCNNDDCRIANSLIEGNYIHDTNRGSVEQGDGIEIKEGSYGNIVRDNVIHDTNYPGIIMYSTVGNGPANIVEGNVIWNVNDNTVQFAADVIFRNNIVLGNVALQSHQSGSPSNIQIVHNTVISTGNGVEVRNVTGPVLVANNAVYAQGAAISLISGDLSQVQLSKNVGAGGLSGGNSGYAEGNGIANDMVNGNYSGHPPINPFPAPASALIDAGDPNYVTSMDFNGTPRSGTPDVGAYMYDANGNPGWAIAEGFKTSAGTSTVKPMPPANLQAD